MHRKNTHTLQSSLSHEASDRSLEASSGQEIDLKLKSASNSSKESDDSKSVCSSASTSSENVERNNTVIFSFALYLRFLYLDISFFLLAVLTCCLKIQNVSGHMLS